MGKILRPSYAEKMERYGREKMLAQKRESYQRNKEHHKAKVYEYRAKNKEKWLAENREYQRKRRISQPDWEYTRSLKKNYGLTLDEFKAMLHSQGNACAICKEAFEHEFWRKPNRMRRRGVVDHCHETGVVRGVLCNLCNVTLGSSRDDSQILRLAALYLEQAAQKAKGA
jgi:hypothetical protein